MEMSVIVNKYFVDIVLFKRKDKNSVIVYDKKDRDYDEEARVRAFRKCVEYGLNNDWQYFLTVTLDEKKIDSKNHDYVIKRILQISIHAPVKSATEKCSCTWPIHWNFNPRARKERDPGKKKLVIVSIGFQSTRP